MILATSPLHSSPGYQLPEVVVNDAMLEATFSNSLLLRCPFLSLSIAFKLYVYMYIGTWDLLRDYYKVWRLRRAGLMYVKKIILNP
jgi:hypothetical protein